MNKETSMSTQVSMSRQKMVAGLIIIVIVALGLGYFIGLKHAQATKTAARGAAAGQYGARGGAGGIGGGRGGFGGLTAGTILSQDANSITVKLASGGSKIVLLGSSTTILKSVAGAVSDLSTGENVTVMGTANPDGSLTATSVQIRPAMPTPTAGTPSSNAPMIPATGTTTGY